MLLQDKKIYLVEDDPSNITIYKALLERHGAQVMFDAWGTNTELNLSIIKHIDCIILDLTLKWSSLNGYDIFDKIRQIPEMREVPIVVVTAADPDEEIRVAKQKGLDGFLGKPIDAKQFPEQIARIISGEKIWFDY